MGLTTPKPPERQSLPGVTATFRVCRTADGKLCREDDPAAAFLAYTVGAVIPVGPEEQAYHRLAHPEPEAVEEPEPEEAPKKAAAPANKMTSRPANKSAHGR